MPTFPKRPEYETPPEGTFVAVCADFFGPWTEERPAQFGGGLVDKVEYAFLLLDELNPKTGKPFRVSSRYTFSVNEKSRLYGDLKSWRGRAFIDDPYAVDLESLIGEMALVTITHKDTPKGLFANISTVTAPPKGTARVPVPGWFVRKKDRERVPVGAGSSRGREREPGEDDDEVGF